MGGDEKEIRRRLRRPLPTRYKRFISSRVESSRCVGDRCCVRRAIPHLRIPSRGGSPMKTACWMMFAALVGLGLTVPVGAAEPANPDPFTFSGPYTYQNLTLFLVHGKDSLPGKKILTLPEALQQKKIIVHETKN